MSRVRTLGLKRMRRSRGLFSHHMRGPSSVSPYSVDCITGTIAKLLNHCEPGRTGDVGLVCLAVASGLKSRGTRPVLPSKSMHSSGGIPQPDMRSGIHEAVISTDGIFGSDRVYETARTLLTDNIRCPLCSTNQLDFQRLGNAFCPDVDQVSSRSHILAQHIFPIPVLRVRSSFIYLIRQ